MIRSSLYTAAYGIGVVIGLFGAGPVLAQQMQWDYEKTKSFTIEAPATRIPRVRGERFSHAFNRGGNVADVTVPQNQGFDVFAFDSAGTNADGTVRYSNDIRGLNVPLAFETVPLTPGMAKEVATSRAGWRV